jgi:hypothetical protein
MTSITFIDTCLVSVHDGGSDELLLCPVLERDPPARAGIETSILQNTDRVRLEVDSFAQFLTVSSRICTFLMAASTLMSSNFKIVALFEAEFCVMSACKRGVCAE